MNLGVDHIKAAVVAIDLHRGHLDMGVATMPTTPDVATRIIAANKRLFDWCRSNGIPIVHQVTSYRDADEIRANPFWRTRAEDPKTTRKNVMRHNIIGGPGCTVMPALFDERDFVVNTKKRYDCFLGTDLDFLLRSHGINTLLITGVNTNSCVLATTTAANVRDYAVIVVEDCVDSMDGSALHEAGLACIRTAFGFVMDTDAVMTLDGLSAARSSAACSFQSQPKEYSSMTGPMIPRERCDYSAIVDRPKLTLPGGARMVIWTIVNLEVWDIAKPMARQVIPAPTGIPLLPDVPNWSWHEYGMRVGVWRFFDLYKKLGIAPTLSINARVCEDYPRVAQQAKDAGWEFMGHAYEQGPIHKETDQRAMIARSLNVIENFTGKRPVGWLGPGLTQTLETPDYLAEAGIKYIGDWVYDDEPTVIRTEKGPLTTLPYTVELNDIPMMMVQHHESTQLLNRAKDSFDRLYAESAERPKIMSIAIHPYISGQPFRIKYLEAIYDYVNQFEGVVHWNGEQILDWYNGQIAGATT